ncbi:hypothetical protein J2T50_001039 [Streptococcus gallinaceus]|uniref:Uncharacterized protein n=1 Tax=Streptococcus gallinaceus TaxID=165758 RepID=A0ABV2JND5_9STRE|nr:hypothetical protein [Streptococcus gallinaceus]MCP1770014.1 hypothetical protein [Streptococcus gallinaceus]
MQSIHKKQVLGLAISLGTKFLLLLGVFVATHFELIY